MKRRIIVISASVLVLALIVGMGFYAQSRTESTKNASTELTDQNIPEGCKKCPEASTCLDANKTDATTDCATKCSDAKTSCDKAKCEKCDKKETCDKSKACAAKECPNKAAASCEKKAETEGCAKSAECKKACEKKSN